MAEALSDTLCRLRREATVLGSYARRRRGTAGIIGGSGKGRQERLRPVDIQRCCVVTYLDLAYSHQLNVAFTAFPKYLVEIVEKIKRFLANHVTKVSKSESNGGVTKRLQAAACQSFFAIPSDHRRSLIVTSY